MTKSTKSTRNLAGAVMVVAASAVAMPASASILDAWNGGNWNTSSPLTQAYFGSSSSLTSSSSSTSSSSTSSSAFVTATATNTGVSVTGSTTGNGTATGTATSIVGGTTTTVTQTFPDDLDVSAVPVPATLPLLAAGFGALGWFRRRQNAKQA